MSASALAVFTWKTPGKAQGIQKPRSSCRRENYSLRVLPSTKWQDPLGIRRDHPFSIWTEVVASQLSFHKPWSWRSSSLFHLWLCGCKAHAHPAITAATATADPLSTRQVAAIKLLEVALAHCNWNFQLSVDCEVDQEKPRLDDSPSLTYHYPRRQSKSAFAIQSLHHSKTKIAPQLAFSWRSLTD